MPLPDGVTIDRRVCNEVAKTNFTEPSYKSLLLMIYDAPFTLVGQLE